MTRFHKWLTTTNNILLIPMFALLMVELTWSETTQVVGFEPANLVFSVFFLSEWALGLYLAEDRKKYLTSFEKLIDFFSALPMSQLFQSARLVRVLRLLRVARIAFRARKYKGRGTDLIRMAGLVGSVIAAGALAIRMIEPNTFTNLEDSLWWSVVTVSTVGYGDIAPVTTEGRFVAMMLMVVGIGVFGYSAGVVSSFLGADDNDDEGPSNADLEARLERIEELLKKQ